MRLSDHTLYVQVIENGFDVLNAHTGKTIRVSASSPFASKRLAIADFELAAETLAKACVQIHPTKHFMGVDVSKLLRTSFIMVMHQTHLNDGGLSPVEQRMLKELGLEAGAREVYLWSGDVLSKEQLLARTWM